MDEPRDEELEEQGVGDDEEEELYELDDSDERSGRRQRLDADFLLDRVIPNEIDWRETVRRHPLISVAAVATVGFLIGRAKGAAIVSGVSAGVTNTVMRQLSDVFDGEVFEF